MAAATPWQYHGKQGDMRNDEVMTTVTPRQDHGKQGEMRNDEVMTTAMPAGSRNMGNDHVVTLRRAVRNAWEAVNLTGSA